MGLYDTDVSVKISQRENEIKSALEKINIPIFDSLQNKLNELTNLRFYQNVKMAKKEDNQANLFVIREKTNNIFNRFNAESSIINLNELKSSFPEKFKQSCWELICLNRFNNFFTAPSKKPENTADLNYEEIIVECTSVSTSRLPDFARILPCFPEVLKVLNLFHRKAKRLNLDGYWYNSVETIWKNFNTDDKKLIDEILSEILLSCKSSEIIFKIHKLLLIFDSVLQYKNIIPSEFIDALEKVGVDFSSRQLRLPRDHVGLNDIAYEFIIDRLIFSLIDKLKKSYFSSKEKPIILSVTLENYASDFCCHIISDDTKRLFNHLMNNSLNFNQKKFQHKFHNQNVVKSIMQALSNLYALHVNTNYYGWFPDKLGCWDSTEKNSCEFIFYNTDHDLSGEYQFDNLASNIGKLSFSQWVICQDSMASI